MRTIKVFLYTFSALVGLFLAAPSQSEVPVAGKVMIVLDASGSMWGQVDGEPKIAIARRVIRDLLLDWDPRLELGLAAYGHRRKGDCTDIEVLVPVGKDNRREVLNAVEKLSPMGKTPLSDAVIMAAESLKYEEERVTVILVSDGEETCGADPCAVGNALEKKGIDFTTHVIGFDVGQEKEAGLRCLAENTGGLYTQARDAGGLQIAFEQTVTEVKKQAAESPPPPKPKPAPEPPKPVAEEKPAPAQPVEAKPAPEPEPRPAPVQPETEKGVKLVALYTMGGKEFEGDIDWSVYESKHDQAGKGKEVLTQRRGKSGHVVRDLPAGKYIFAARLSDAGYISREWAIQVEQDQAVVHELDLNIGTVRLEARPAEGGAPFEENLTWQVLSPEADASGNRQKIAEWKYQKSGSIYLIPAGKWRIAGALTDAAYVRADKEITVEPGSKVAHDFVFNAGWVRFDAGLAEGAEPFQENLNWRVLAPEKDFSGNRQQIAGWKYQKSGSIHVIPAGKWRIEGALTDAAYVRADKEITVEPGSKVAHDFVFNAGRVRFDAGLAEGAEPLQEDLNWRVLAPEKDFSGNRQQIAAWRRHKSGAIFLIPAGKWLVEGRITDAGYINTSKTILVEPGGEEIHDFVFNAGRVRFNGRLSEGGESFDGDLGWHVLNAKTDLAGKREELASFRREKSGKTLLIPAGEWLVHGYFADYGHVKAAHELALGPGDEKTLDVNFHAGRVEFEITYDGKPFEGQAAWEILESKEDLSGNRRSIISGRRTESGYATFLHSGEYLIRMSDEADGAVRGEHLFTVRAGEDSKIRIDLSK